MAATCSPHKTASSNTRLLACACLVALASRVLPAQTPFTVREAPQPSHYVILTDLSDKDPYFAAAIRLQQHRAAEIVRFKPERLIDSLEALRRLQPAFVAFVLKPETLDINFAYDALELSVKLDDDPFPDFAHGFITGSTPKDTLGLVENTIEAEAHRERFPRKAFLFGPSSVAQVDDDSNFGWASSWECVRLRHEPGSFPNDRLGTLASSGAVRFWGHGSPQAIAGSLSYRDIRRLDLFPVVVFGGPCFSGVVNRSYDWDDDSHQVEVNSVPPDESLALTFIGRGATGYFGALHKDKCTSAGQEMEYALVTGDPLGMVAKYTYDTIVVARGGRALDFPRLRAGELPPKEDSLDFQVNRAAGRILLGDPAFRPFGEAANRPVSTSIRRTSSGLEITAAVADPRVRCLFTDVFRTDLCTCDSANDRLYFKVQLPSDFGAIKGVTHAPLEGPLKEIKHTAVSWVEERWLNQRFLHLQMDFAHDTLKKPDVVARFLVESE